MTTEELYERKERAESASAYIENIGETNAQKDAVNNAISVIGEYIALINELIEQK